MIDHDVMKYISSENEYLDSSQTINYVECHDDYTFFDRMSIFLENDDEETIRKRCFLALALVLLSRGFPFIHSGQEFMRTKEGLRNSYNAPDKINKLDWDLRVKNDDLVRKTEDLIRLRKNIIDFNASDVKVSFRILGRILQYKAGETSVYFNPSNDDLTYEDGLKHHVIFDDEGICDCIRENVFVSAHSLVICKE